MDVLRGLRVRWPRPGQGPGPDAGGAALSWIGHERIAISGVPSAQAVSRLAEQGVTHVVNCAGAGAGAVVRGSGGRTGGLRPRASGARAHAGSRPAAKGRGVGRAARFAARVVDDQPQAGVLIHCGAGRRRSVMLAYAVLRLRGQDRTQAAALVLRYRTGAQFVPAYVRSVERWLATAAGDSVSAKS
jgi:hypothetical protein